MRENGVAEFLIWKLCQHRGLHHGHDLSRLGAEHREAENEVIICADHGFHETLRLVRRLCSQHGAHRQLRDPHRDAVALRVAFAQSHVRERRIGKHAIGHEPIARAALFSGQVVPDDAEVVPGDMSELRAAGAVTHGPHVGRGGLQPLIDANVTASIQHDPGVLEPDPLRVRNASRRDQEMAAVDLLFAG
jgi:hypothetical protein